MKNTLSIILECLLQEVFQNTLIYILTYWYILACFRKTSGRPDLSFNFFLSYFMGIWSYIIIQIWKCIQSIPRRFQKCLVEKLQWLREENENVTASVNKDVDNR